MIGADPDPETFGAIALETAYIQRDLEQAGASGFITSNGTALGIIEQAH